MNYGCICRLTARIRQWFLLAAGLLCLAGVSLGRAEPAYANAPVPRFDFDITVTNPPEEAYGVDFLVPADKIPAEEYTECNEAALTEAGLAPGCPLATLSEGGYVSFMAHDTKGRFEGELRTEGRILSVYGCSAAYDLIGGAEWQARLALFDKEGNVLLVSDPFFAYKSKARDYNGELHLDAATGIVLSNGEPGGSVKTDADGKPLPMDPFEDSGGGILEFLFIGVAGILLLLLTLAGACLLTIVIELLVGLIFRLKPIWWVIPVNLVSNLLFNILLLICNVFLGLNYNVCLAVGELLVIAGEFLVYKSVYNETDPKRLLLYTVVANIASAAIGLLLLGQVFG